MNIIRTLGIWISLISVITCYEFTSASCSNALRLQSPININLQDTFYAEEKYFRFLSNNYDFITTDNYWRNFPEEKAIGIAGLDEDMGSFILVKDWSMYSFRLKKVLFRVRSEHSLDGNYYDAEMQLVHTLDNNYYPPGRRVHLPSNYLVISVLFKIANDANPGVSQLFKFMNLEEFAQNKTAKMAKNIKLYHIIQHQPSYLYQGTLTYPSCEPTLWMVFANYHLISQTDYNNLKIAVQRSGYSDPATGFTVRDMHTNEITPVYRNWKDTTQMISRPTLMTYNSCQWIQLSFLMIIAILAITLL